jgi:hypothetical protein
MKIISEAADRIRVGRSMTYRNLTIFPLFGSPDKSTDYLTLDEALAQKCAAITEVSDGGSVPELKFVNSGDRRVFLLDGEELIGAKQNRVLNLSILAPAGKTLIVPVSCVESGRWHHRSREFSSAPRVHYAEGRARKMAQVSASLRTTGQRRSDQGEVWHHIEEKFHTFQASSGTSAMSDLYAHEAGRIEDYVRGFSVLEGQTGAVFAISGRIAGLELFDCSGTLRKLFPKILRSYSLDAIEAAMSESRKRKPQCTVEKAAAFVKRVSRAKAEEFPAVGEGRDLRLTGRNLTGAALAADDNIVHLSAFHVTHEQAL